jgi:hypothetical protein
MKSLLPYMLNLLKHFTPFFSHHISPSLELSVVFPDYRFLSTCQRSHPLGVPGFHATFNGLLNLKDPNRRIWQGEWRSLCQRQVPRWSLWVQLVAILVQVPHVHLEPRELCVRTYAPLPSTSLLTFSNEQSPLHPLCPLLPSAPSSGQAVVPSLRMGGTAVWHRGLV